MNNTENKLNQHGLLTTELHWENAAYAADVLELKPNNEYWKQVLESEGTKSVKALAIQLEFGELDNDALHELMEDNNDVMDHVPDCLVEYLLDQNLVIAKQLKN